MKILPVQFEQHAIRRIYDEKTQAWFFSVVDIIQVLTRQRDYQAARKYWNKLKERLKKEGSQSVTYCHQLKLPAADGKNYLTDIYRQPKPRLLKALRAQDRVLRGPNELPQRPTPQTMKTNKSIARREFVKRAAQAAAVVAVGETLMASAAPAEKPAPSAGALPMRTLGKTGLKLPILGFGGAGLPTRWGNPLSQDERVALLRRAYDQGVRYYDTAPCYFESQAIMGEALKDRRQEVCLVTKVDGTNPAIVRKQFEASLKALQTDHVDVLHIHGTPGLEQMTVPEAMKIHAEMVKLRDAKLTRFIGFSAHGYFDKALALIKTGGFDLCMLSYGYIGRGYDQRWTAALTKLRNDCLDKAHELGMGIVAMKVIGAGMLGVRSATLVPAFGPQRLKQLPAAAIRHIMQDERVHVLNIGMRLPAELEANLKVIASQAACTPADRTLLADYAAKLYETPAYKRLKLE